RCRRWCLRAPPPPTTRRERPGPPRGAACGSGPACASRSATTLPRTGARPAERAATARASRAPERFAEAYRAARPAGRRSTERSAHGLSPDGLRIRAARRAEIWQKQVRPLALTMMLLGPGLGLGMSTLLGALGMGALGDAMGTQTSADALASIMAHAYREISYAYFLMVGGTFPMLLGPVIVLAARRLDEDGHDAR